MKPKEISVLRKRMDITQIELAEKLGVSRASVAKYESGAIQPSSKVTEKLNQLAFSKPKISREEIDTHLKIQQRLEVNKWLVKMFNALESDQRLSLFDTLRRMYKENNAAIDNLVPD